MTNIVRPRISEIISPHFFPIHVSLSKKEFGAYWLGGGRGSTKSSFTPIEIILMIILDPEANAIAFRKVGDTVRTSIYTSFLWAMDMLKVTHLFKSTVSPAEFTYIPTGQQIILKGLDDPMKLKSIRPRKGLFKILWFEELPEFYGMEEVRSVRQSILRGGDYAIEFATFNPPNDPDNWVNKEAKIDMPSRLVHKSTYLDVPAEWLGNRFIEEAEWLRDNNPMAYEHEYMGEAVGLNEAIIFSGKYKVRDFNVESSWSGPYFGIDWGFSQDPLAVVKCWIEECDGRQRLYIEQEAFGIGVDIDDTPDFVRALTGEDRHRIYADNARPEMVSHLKLRGFNVMAARKWKGSVEDGIAALRNFVEIVIHPRCKNLQQEFRLYSYKIDKFTKDVTPDIVDKHNHGIDAIRYALDKMIKPRGKGRFSHDLQ